MTAMCSGGHHVLVRTTDSPRSCYAWGCGTSGQLGLGDLLNRPHPTALSASSFGEDATLRHVACGERHSVALLEDGRLLAWGGGLEAHVGALGPPVWPALVPNLTGLHVTSVSCGGSSVAALTETGAVLWWEGGTAREVPFPPHSRLGSSTAACTAIACGGDHALVLRDSRPLADHMSPSTDTTGAGAASRPLERHSAPLASWSRLVSGALAADVGGGVSRALDVEAKGKPVRQVLAEVDGVINELEAQRSELARRRQLHEARLGSRRRAARALRLARDEARARLLPLSVGLSELSTELAQTEMEMTSLRVGAATEASIREATLEATCVAAMREGAAAATLDAAHIMLRGCLVRSDGAALSRAFCDWRAMAHALMVSQRAVRDEVGRASSTRAQQESDETTRIVRRCYATDKLGSALGLSAAMPLRLAWSRWWLSACALEGEAAADEADALKLEVADELRQNAVLQQRVTAHDLAAASWLEHGGAPGTAGGASMGGRGTEDRLAFEREAKRAGAAEALEREAREAKRAAAVARGHATQLETELATAHRRIDQLSSQVRSTSSSRPGSRPPSHAPSRPISRPGTPERRPSIPPSAPPLADGLIAGALLEPSADDEVHVLRLELQTLRRFVALAAGAHRFARWRILLHAMHRKRAEQRAAVAQAARRPAVASDEYLADFLALRLVPFRKRAVSALVGGLTPRVDCARALWRWHTAAVSKAAAAAARLAAAAAAAAAVSEAVGPASADAAAAHANAEAARDELMRLRSERDREGDADGMLHEAVQMGDAQTRRVLQLQRAVGVTRRALAGCLLRACLAAAGRSQCAHLFRRWLASISALGMGRASADARSARADAEKARSTARSAEGIAKEAQDAAARDVDAVRKKLVAAERSRTSLRSELGALREELESERRSAASAAAESERRISLLERAKAKDAARAQQLDVVQGQRNELEGQLRALRQKLRASILPAPPSTPGVASGSPVAADALPSPPPSGASVAADADVGLDAQLATERREKEEALALRTRAVRDLRHRQNELEGMVAQLGEARRTAAVARLLAHARSRIGRPAQMLRLLAALLEWAAIVRQLQQGPTAATTLLELRRSQLSELKGRLQHAALLWSLRRRCSALAAWRAAVLQPPPLLLGGGEALPTVAEAAVAGASPGGFERQVDSREIEHLLREVQAMKYEVHGRAGSRS